jgi:hypothetical protein
VAAREFALSFLRDFPRAGACIMKIPDNLRIPILVFSLEAVLLVGCGLIFLVLLPHAA